MGFLDCFLFKKRTMMKIDLSGLDPSAPVKGNRGDLDNEILDAPSFSLPSTVDVSSTDAISFILAFLLPLLLSEPEMAKFSFLFFLFSLMGSRKLQYKWWSLQRGRQLWHLYLKKVSWLLLIPVRAWEDIYVRLYSFLM